MSNIGNCTMNNNPGNLKQEATPASNLYLICHSNNYCHGHVNNGGYLQHSWLFIVIFEPIICLKRLKIRLCGKETYPFSC